MKNSQNLNNKIHIRRCHVCGNVNQKKKDFVKKCTSCGKALAPFMFFDEKNDFDPTFKVDAKTIDLDDVRLKSGSLYEHMKTQYPPLWGITVYW